MRDCTYAQAINESLRENLARDEKVILMGEDIARFGGIFQVTAGLAKEFGEDRVIDTPISESVIVGSGIGAAVTGMRPVVELMFADFVMVAMDQIANQAAKIRYMYGGKAKVPLVIRSPIGAGRGASAQHSQSPHALFMHIPGLKIAIPSNPFDAKGLLNTAIEDDNPVLFFEDKMLYAMEGDVPEEYYKVPFGEAKIVREGQDITVIATFGMVRKALKVAEEADPGISIEVVDPRTLCPLDKNRILESVKKTGRLITVDEGNKTGGMGSEIAAMVAEEAVEYLEAPIQRVAAPMTPVPYSKPLEDYYIPDEGDIRSAVEKISGFL
jgi:pyruvate dehydrogenase E1 component beta subunit